MESEKPFLDTYRSYNTVPTRQDISDLSAHFNRRCGLLRTLGIIPSHLSGKKIIEFGPGSGENSIYYASLKPNQYTLVDGTESSIRSVESYHRKYYHDINVKIDQHDFFDYPLGDLFDAVFCEGAIPTQTEPERLLRHVASFVKTGGVLVITCVDSVSFLSEGIRRLLARLHVGRAHLHISDLPKLMNFFEKDLDTLGPMSRCREDWILDQIIHPWSGPPFSIAEAITTLKGSYSPHGSSPRFFEDWRWYKSIVKDEDGFADALSDSYYRQLHNLIDYRHISGQADRSINECLLDYANNIYTDLFEIERGHAPFSTQKIAGLLRNIVDHCPQLNPATIESITNSIRLLTQGMGEVSTIGNWWGRGQQYLSFIRLKAESSTI